MGCTSSKSAENAWEHTVDHEQRELLAKTLKHAPTVLDPYSFEIGNFIQHGGMGSIYAATRKDVNGQVALKFFGYTAVPPLSESVMLEIELMQAMQGAHGAMKLYGIFMDSEDGLIQNKRFKEVQPVIVMEYLEGGDMFAKIQRTAITEKEIIEIVIEMVKGLADIHSRGFVHRDIKLENVMFATKTPESRVCIIDYGMMITIPPGSDKYVGREAVGSPGCIAPESLTRKEYSAKSDMWQLGCTLYCLVSGFDAFYPDVDKQIIRGDYFPMKGEGWDDISDDGKSFIANLLVVDPEKRPTCEQLLEHPWLHKEVSDRALGVNYSERMKNMAMKAKIKQFFVDNDAHIKSSSSQGQSGLTELLPGLLGDRHLSPELQVNTSFYGKLKEFQDETVASLRAGGGGVELNFQQFSDSLTGVGLSELASRPVFDIFDYDNTGGISLKEFLIVMASLRKNNTKIVTVEEKDSYNGGASALTFIPDEEGMRLYFDIFDLDRNGTLDMDEVKLLLECILRDGINPYHASMLSLHDDKTEEEESASFTQKLKYHPASMSNVRETFEVMDVSKDGKIDYEEFKHFYMALMKGGDIPVSVSRGSLCSVTEDDNNSTGILDGNVEPTALLGQTDSVNVDDKEVVVASSSPIIDGEELHAEPVEVDRISTLSVNKKVGAGLAARMAGLDPSKMGMVGTPAVAVPKKDDKCSNDDIDRDKNASSDQQDVNRAPTLSVNKKVGAGLAARMAGLDPSKMIMPGTPPPGGMQPWKNSGLAASGSRSAAVSVVTGDAATEDGSFSNATLNRPVLSSEKPRKQKKVPKLDFKELEQIEK